jgi:hypothetical protein
LCSLFLSILPQIESNGKSEPQIVTALFAVPEALFVIPDESDLVAATMDEQQLEVFAAYPYNYRIQLDLGKMSEDLPLERVNQLLRESQHVRHLGVEESLAKFDSSNSSFSSNPRLHSLHLNRIFQGEISKNLLDGVAVNMCIQDLELNFREHGLEQERFLKTLEYLFQIVLPKCRSLRSLTLAFSIECFEDRLLFFEKVVQCIATSSLSPRRKLKTRFGSLVSLRIFTFRGTEATEAPNEMFNRIVSHSLALSWCEQSRNEQSWSDSVELAVPAGLVASMVCATNQDVVYVKTTGHALRDTPRPFDSRTANVSVIYDLVRSFHPDFSESEAASL